MIRIRIKIVDDELEPPLRTTCSCTAAGNTYHEILDTALGALRGALVAAGYFDDWDAHDWPSADLDTPGERTSR